MATDPPEVEELSSLLQALRMTHDNADQEVAVVQRVEQIHQEQQSKNMSHVWDNAKHLFDLLHRTNEEIAQWQSQWTRYDDLVRFGWQLQRDHSTDSTTICDLVSLKSFFEAPKASGGLGTSLEIKNSAYFVSHEQEGPIPELYDIPGRPGAQYPYTVSNACYMNYFLPLQGLIIARANHSPRACTETPRYTANVTGPIYLTPLQHWSDVAFLEWVKQCRKFSVSPGSLTKVLQHKITNMTTKAIIDQALATAPIDGSGTPSVWPGKTFLLKAEEEEGRVAKKLLRTPNGVGVAHLLFEHREQLGRKTVKAVTVFSSDKGELDLLFEIVDIES